MNNDNNDNNINNKVMKQKKMYLPLKLPKC